MLKQEINTLSSINRSIVRREKRSEEYLSYLEIEMGELEDRSNMPVTPSGHSISHVSFRRFWPPAWRIFIAKNHIHKESICLLNLTVIAVGW